MVTNKQRPIRLPERAWQPTAAGDLAPLPDPLRSAERRPQPPLREVLQGLDARELEGPTVFDQLFGAPPSGEARPRRR